MQRRRLHVLGVLFSILAPQWASAQAVQNIVLRNSFNPVGAGARGLGMGGAFIAVADDGTAASFNPAGLAQLRRTELALVGFGDELTSTLVIPRFESTETTSTRTRHGAPDFAGLSIPFTVASRNLTLQLSYQRAVDLFGKGRATVFDTLDLRDFDPDLRGTADFIADIAPAQSGAFHTGTAAAGYQVTSHLSLGASLNYWIAEWTAEGTTFLRQRITVQGGRPREAPLFAQDFYQEQGLRGLNLNMGFLLRHSWIGIGGVFRLPFTGDYTLNENTVFTYFDDDAQPFRDNRSFTVASRLHWPRSAGVGLALRPFRGLTLAGDYSRSTWSRMFIEDVPGGALLTSETFDAEGNLQETFTDRNFFDLLPAPRTDTSDTDQWRAGLEYLVLIPKVIVPLRGGVFQDRSPVAELGTTKGRLIEGWTVGTGLNFSRLVLDVAFERRRSEGSVGLRLRQGEQVGAPRDTPREKVREDRLVASLIYRFGGENDPLKRLIRAIFGGSSSDK